jgi:hypothetical protein
VGGETAAIRRRSGADRSPFWAVVATPLGHAPPGRQKSRREGEDTPNAPRASADPGFPHDCFAGCEAQHQQTAFAKKKQQDAVFFVKTAPRASADPGFPHDCFAGRDAQHQQTAFAKKKQQDAVFFVKTAPRASADPGFPVSESGRFDAYAYGDNGLQ